ncbi:MAG: ferrochelatase [Acidimicrobiales bacterium]|nr:ferrochelatase [Acidimicrobiales bacterium]
MSDRDGSAPTSAVLVVSFGGPEGPDDVVPFLERVTHGRDVPPDRLKAVARQYLRFGGVSPINGQNRALVAALTDELRHHDLHLPVYWGNRNWHPLLADTVAAMRDDGIEHAWCFVTSAFGSYSGCRQYLEDLDRARAEVGRGAPTLAKLRLYWNHPGFLKPFVDATAAAWSEISAARSPRLVFTAHSLPLALADSSPYVSQLRRAAAIVASDAAPAADWDLVFQSRSGPPRVPWLEPDIGAHLRSLADAGHDAVVVVPLGFTSDHQEVVFDLDTQAAEIAAEVGLRMVRVPTPGTHPAFVAMIRELVEERLDGSGDQRRVWPGTTAEPDICSPTCCHQLGTVPA